MTFKNDGSLLLDETRHTASHTESGAWLSSINSTEAALYEVSTSSITGAFTNAAAASGAWVSLGTDRAWDLFCTGASSPTPSTTVTATFTIRKIGTTTPTWARTVTLSANYDPAF
jgi:hypothetical protein